MQEDKSFPIYNDQGEPVLYGKIMFGVVRLENGVPMKGDICFESFAELRAFMKRLEENENRIDQLDLTD